jgi:hypothetical protein
MPAKALSDCRPLRGSFAVRRSHHQSEPCGIFSVRLSPSGGQSDQVHCLALHVHRSLFRGPPSASLHLRTSTGSTLRVCSSAGQTARHALRFDPAGGWRCPAGARFAEGGPSSLLEWTDRREPTGREAARLPPARSGPTWRSWREKGSAGVRCSPAEHLCYAVVSVASVVSA